MVCICVACPNMALFAQGDAYPLAFPRTPKADCLLPTHKCKGDSGLYGSNVANELPLRPSSRDAITIE
jgi:hypothetical protein